MVGDVRGVLEDLRIWRNGIGRLLLGKLAVGFSEMLVRVVRRGEEGRGRESGVPARRGSSPVRSGLSCLEASEIREKERGRVVLVRFPVGELDGVSVSESE